MDKKKQVVSIYRKQVYVRGVWGGGGDSPQKPTTHYKNKIKRRLFLYSVPGYFFIIFFRPGQIFFYSFQRQVIFSMEDVF